MGFLGLGFIVAVPSFPLRRLMCKARAVAVVPLLCHRSDDCRFGAQTDLCAEAWFSRVEQVRGALRPDLSTIRPIALEIYPLRKRSPCNRFDGSPSKRWSIESSLPRDAPIPRDHFPPLSTSQATTRVAFARHSKWLSYLPWIVSQRENIFVHRNEVDYLFPHLSPPEPRHGKRRRASQSSSPRPQKEWAREAYYQLLTLLLIHPADMSEEAPK
jgi:hypothetical protein